MSSYAQDSGSGGGSVYAQTGTSSGSAYSGGGGTPAPAKKKKSGGGILGTLEHIVTQGGSDLYHAAVNTPAGLAAVYHALDEATKAGWSLDDPHLKPLKDLAKGYEQSLVQSVKHPLRNPGYTLLNALPVVNAAAKAGMVGKLAKAGEVTGPAGVAKALVSKLPTPPRTLKVGGLEVRGHYSPSASSQLVQRGVDAGLQKASQGTSKVALKAENVLHKRAAKWEARNQRVADAVARAPGTRLQVLGKSLKPAELRALRLVAEETPVARRLGAQEMRMARATGKEVARHQERIDVTKAAMDFLDVHPTTGKPVFKPTATKLQKVYDALKVASTDREGMLKNLGLMDEAAQQAAKTKIARIAAGATTKTDYAAATSDLTAGQTVRVVGQKTPGKVAEVHPGGEATIYYPRFNRSVRLPISRLETVGKPTLKGAEDITASPSAVFVGNPVERARLTGKPKVSSTSTFGHTQKPSSLRTSTGASVEHALERQDVTNIVAERHAEAVRLTTIDRVRDRFKQAGEQAPRRKDDVFMWTDKLISNERIPKIVRQYLDNPEGLAKLPPSERLSVTEQIKQAVFEHHDWRDQSAVAEFTQLAKEGKGVFVPRRLLGSYGKREISLSSVPGVDFVDAVNNAQKAELVYLKLNYPVVQSLSNTAMNIIHQGFAAPVRLTQAVKLDRAIGADFAAITDDIMGSGAIMMVAFEGQGTVSRMTQKLAHFMSNKVDTPARRAAMLHEAHKAGFGTPERYKALLTEDRYAGDLAEVAQRAVEAIVDYGEMSPFERNVVRRLIFVYPWQKGSTKYAGHFLRDHPVQAAALGLTSQQADQSLGPHPSYLDGVFKAAGGLVNPSGVNFFQTPAQIGQALAGTVTGNMSTSAQLQNFLAPFPGVATALLTGRDDLGRPLQGNLAAKLRDLLVAPTPAAGVLRAAAPNADLAKALLGNRTSSKSFPNPNDAFYRFLLGGLYPRDYSQPAINRNAALEKTGR